ncbi:unnamed protein product [Oppiella nova]|uniref:Uncharacterized protein n=1 Tax=Oppiella nova TaxID=334625 RepID=A0A7R9QPH0_9ACAR|nr:unnamed protein product [Oppiella nova]CAG2170239.1 unnamed protein product [Oppiella nova]
MITKLDKDWYKMNHHFQSHNNGESPNAEVNDNRYISCDIPKDHGDYKEFNWEFIERPGYENKNGNKDNSNKTGLIVAVSMLATKLVLTKVS